jgi:methionyl-tRNA synthetase
VKPYLGVVVAGGRFIVTSAWPYVNHVPHLGTLIGSILSADIYARYLRLRGHEVIFVSGSDEHGTPIEIEARMKRVEPRELNVILMYLVG